MKKNIFKYYYLILATVLIFQAISTVAQLSHTICYQHKIAKLQQQKLALTNQKQVVDQQLSQALSLTNTQLALNKDYQTIDQTLVLEASSFVASR